MRRLEVYARVRVGVLDRIQQIMAIKKKAHIGDNAQAIVANPWLLPKYREPGIVSLAVLTPKEMGFRKTATMSELLDRAFLRRWSEENLERQRIGLCPHETALSFIIERESEALPRELTFAMQGVSLKVRGFDKTGVLKVDRRGGFTYLSAWWIGERATFIHDQPIAFALRTL